MAVRKGGRKRVPSRGQARGKAAAKARKASRANQANNRLFASETQKGLKALAARAPKTAGAKGRAALLGSARALGGTLGRNH